MAKTFRTTDQRGSVVLTLQNSSGSDLRLLTLPITPEEISIIRPSRQAVTQTLTSAYQDHLGSGIVSVNVRGHTGWRDLGSVNRSDLGSGTGYEVIKNLRDLLGDYDNRVARGDPSTVRLLLMLNLPNGWEMFRVSKNGASFSRSRQQPLLYRYELQFIVLEDMNAATKQVDPSPNFVITLLNAPSVKLTGGGGGKTYQAVASGDSDQTGRVIVNQSDSGPALDPGIVDTTTSVFSQFDDGLSGASTTGSGSMTLRAFSDFQYVPTSAYPSGMWQYIVAANPSLFAGANSDPYQVIIPAGTTLRVPQISQGDAWDNKNMTMSEVVAATRFGGSGLTIIGGTGALDVTFEDVFLPFNTTDLLRGSTIGPNEHWDDHFQTWTKS